MARKSLEKTKTYSKKLWRLIEEGNMVNKHTRYAYMNNERILGDFVKDFLCRDEDHNPVIPYRLLKKAKTISNVREILRVTKAREEAYKLWNKETEKWFW
jgi:hypothetical protein